MEREIKFKGLAEDDRWVEGRLSYDYYDGFIHIIITKELKEYQIKEETLCQYTGLKDKNGVDIYEGDTHTDFLLSQQVSCVIRYKNGAFYSCLDKGQIDDCDEDLFDKLLKDIKEIEITGNIHDQNN